MLLEEVCETLFDQLTAVAPFDTADSVFIEGYHEEIAAGIEAAVAANNWAIVIEAPTWTLLHDEIGDPESVILDAQVTVGLIVDEQPLSHDGLNMARQAFAAVLAAGDFRATETPLEKPFEETGLSIFALNFYTHASLS
jgi:hypothetical protein